MTVVKAFILTLLFYPLNRQKNVRISDCENTLGYPDKPTLILAAIVWSRDENGPGVFTSPVGYAHRKATRRPTRRDSISDMVWGQRAYWSFLKMWPPTFDAYATLRTRKAGAKIEGVWSSQNELDWGIQLTLLKVYHQLYFLPYSLFEKRSTCWRVARDYPRNSRRRQAPVVPLKRFACQQCLFDASFLSLAGITSTSSSLTPPCRSALFVGAGSTSRVRWG